jgi:hypothetical protein
LNLYQAASADTADPRDDQNLEADAIRGHLAPLNLAPEGTPLVELARLAALAILRADL